MTTLNSAENPNYVVGHIFSVGQIKKPNPGALMKPTQAQVAAVQLRKGILTPPPGPRGTPSYENSKLTS